MAKVHNVSIQTIHPNGKVSTQQLLGHKNITVEAVDNYRFKLINEINGKSPEQIITQKQGDDLVIKLSEQANQPTITINNFYAVENSQLVGVSANGELYSYNLATSSVETTSLLAEHIIASSEPFLVNPWYVAGGLAAVGGVALGAGGGGGGGGSSSSESSAGFIYTQPYISFDLYDRNPSKLEDNLEDFNAYNALPKELLFSIGSISQPKKAVIIKDGTSINGSLDEYEKDFNTNFYASREKINSTKNSSVDFKVKVDFKDGSSVSKNYTLGDYDDIKAMTFTDANEILFFRNPIADNTSIDLKGGYDALIYDSEIMHNVNNFTLKANILENYDMKNLNFNNSKFEVDFSNYLNFGDLTNTIISGTDLTINGRNATGVEINIQDKYTKYFENDIYLENVSDSTIKLGAGDNYLGFINLKNSTVETGAGDDYININALNNVKANNIDGGSGRDTLALNNQNYSGKLSIDSSQFKNFEWFEASGAIEVNLKYSDLVADTGRDGELNIIYLPQKIGLKSEIVFAEPDKWQKQVGVKTDTYKTYDTNYSIDHNSDSKGMKTATFDRYHYIGANGDRNDVLIDQDLITNII